MRRAGITYLVVYCDDLVACRDFYASLGLEFVEEQHGATGIVHYSATQAGGVVFELYPAGSDGGATGRLRIGLEVPVGSCGRRAGPGRYAFRDPEGRAVELTVVAR